MPKESAPLPHPREKLPQTPAGLDAFLAKFESAQVAKEDWHHAEHVVVAYGYLLKFSEAETIDKLRAGLKKLLNAYGIVTTADAGYHETWTIFFVKLLRGHIESANRLGNQRERHDGAAVVDSDASFADKLQNAVEDLKDFRALTRAHYSESRILSPEARARWVEPDLKPL